MKTYKKDFPIFSTHPSLIYLDSAATAQKPQRVIDAVSNFYTSYNANIHRGLYPIAEKATKEVEDVRQKVARFINAQQKEEIVFTHGTTEGINLLANGLKAYIHEGDGILVTEMEHHSNLIPWQKIAKEKEAKLYYWAVGNDGLLSGEIKDEYDKTVFHSVSEIPQLSIVAFCHVSNVLGTLVDVEKIVEQTKIYAKEKNVSSPITIVDGAQSIPHMPIDVQKLGCDFFVFSSHKIMGPTGVGIVYGKMELLEKVEPLLVGSQMIRDVTKNKTTYAAAPERFESGTLPLEGIIGMGAAIDYLQYVGMDVVRRHEKNLIAYALATLKKIDGIRIYGPLHEEQRIGVISFTVDGIHPHDIAQVLGDMNICIRAGHHCAQVLHKTLGLSATARMSFALYNTNEDVDRLIEGIQKCIKLFQ